MSDKKKWVTKNNVWQNFIHYTPQKNTHRVYSLPLQVLFHNFPRWLFKEMYRKLSKRGVLYAFSYLILEFPQKKLCNVSLKRIRIGYIPSLCEYYFTNFQDGCLKKRCRKLSNLGKKKWVTKRNEWQNSYQNSYQNLTQKGGRRGGFPPSLYKIDFKMFG